MNKNYKICVLGGGSFGTVLANLAASKGHDVSLWVKDSDKALRINSESRNTEYHPELKLSNNIIASEKLLQVKLLMMSLIDSLTSRWIIR